MLWVDLCYEDILGEARIEFVTPRARRVTSLMPRQAEKYVEEVRAGYQSENLIERIRKLEAAADAQGWNETLETEFNKIHSLVHKIKRRAERAARKLRTGKIAWSPKLQKYWDEVELWNMLVRRKLGCAISSRKIRRYLKRMPHIEGAFTLDLEGLRNVPASKY